MPAPSISPDPQYVPANFAWGNLLDLNSNIPRICGYALPPTHSAADVLAPGYFGPDQSTSRPTVTGLRSATVGVVLDGTDSENQGQPGLGATLPFGSLIFWAQQTPAGTAKGFAVRIDLNNSGYGKYPPLTEVITNGGVF